MNKFILIALIILGLFSCNQKFETLKSENDSITSVPGEDIKMNLIIKNARETIDDFLLAYSNPKSDESSFQLKYPFDTDPGSKNDVEHIWIDSIKKENEYEFSGIVQNEPFYIKSMKLGDSIKFDLRKISDWMYIKNNKIIGGKSIKYLMENIPENERDEEINNILKIFE